MVATAGNWEIRRPHLVLMNKIILTVLLLVSSSVYAEGWNEAIIGQQQPLQIVPVIQPSRKGLALFALDRLGMLPTPVRRVFVLREDERGSAVMSYSIDKHKGAISLRITF